LVSAAALSRLALSLYFPRIVKGNGPAYLPSLRLMNYIVNGEKLG